MVTDSFSRIVESLRRTTDKGQTVLRLFNHPEWHEAAQAIFETVDAIRDKHQDGARPSVVDDYLHLAMAISQFDWLDDESDEEDQDQRFEQLKSIVGIMRIDVDRIIHLCGRAGGGPSYAEEVLPSGTVRLSKEEYPGVFRAIEKRLLRIETALVRDIEIHQSFGTSVSQHKLVDYFVRSVRCDVSVVKASLRTGSNVDLSVLERASISMLDVTGRMIATINSKFSQATDELRSAVVRIREPVRRLATGVRTFLKYVLHVASRPLADESSAADQLEEASPRGGDLLREARERLGLSLEDVRRESRVGIRFLVALEKGDFSEFSAEHYAIGFGKSYARAVGESEEMIAAMLRRDLRRAGFKPKRMKDVQWTGNPGDSKWYHGPLMLDVEPIPEPYVPRSKKDSDQT